MFQRTKHRALPIRPKNNRFPATTGVDVYKRQRLRSVDQVAYVRFASVYRQFKDIDTFMAELNKLLSEK